ncbi:MAG TPA: hypothetical protein VF489_00290 [Sphingobium sp.]
MGKITVREFEQKVLEKEEITIVIRGPAGALVDDYDFDRCAAAATSLSSWIETRIKPRIGEYEYDVVSPDYAVSTPHGRTKMGTLRDKYER